MEQRVTIGEGGRFVIPAAYRKALHVKPGDELVVRLDDGEIRIFNQKQALKRIREAVKRHKHGKNMTDDFLAFRKKDSE
jgi:AbrB family looped-hinge helix DNA binding protein